MREAHEVHECQCVVELGSEFSMLVQIVDGKLIVLTFTPVLCVVFDREVVQEDEKAARTQQAQIDPSLVQLQI